MGYDVIIVGAGHNGLITAIRLAQKGKRVGEGDDPVDLIGGEPCVANGGITALDGQA